MFSIEYPSPDEIFPRSRRFKRAPAEDLEPENRTSDGARSTSGPVVVPKSSSALGFLRKSMGNIFASITSPKWYSQTPPCTSCRWVSSVPETLSANNLWGLVVKGYTVLGQAMLPSPEMATKGCERCKLFMEHPSPDISEWREDTKVVDVVLYNLLRFMPVAPGDDDGKTPRIIPAVMFVRSGFHPLELAGALLTSEGKLLFCADSSPGLQSIVTSVFTPRRLSQRFNTALASRWLEATETSFARSPVGIQGLRFIDCKTKNIIPAPRDSRYAALSYVWGHSGIPDDGKEDGVSAAVPRVVEDAIEVTKVLGIPYLWVDKLCIDQDDAKSKHQQISQMHNIYQNATLTIIAAAGEDAGYGLPGVGARMRTAGNTSFRLGPVDVYSFPSVPSAEIRSSKWATRGWTYQEAALSQRCLVFLDEQIYFECQEMAESESLDLLGRLSILKKTSRAIVRLPNVTAHSSVLLSFPPFPSHVSRRPLTMLV